MFMMYTSSKAGIDRSPTSKPEGSQRVDMVCRPFSGQPKISPSPPLIIFGPSIKPVFFIKSPCATALSLLRCSRLCEPCVFCRVKQSSRGRAGLLHPAKNAGFAKTRPLIHNLNFQRVQWMRYQVLQGRIYLLMCCYSRQSMQTLCLNHYCKMLTPLLML